MTTYDANFANLRVTTEYKQFVIQVPVDVMPEVFQYGSKVRIKISTGVKRPIIELVELQPQHETEAYQQAIKLLEDW